MNLLIVAIYDGGYEWSIRNKYDELTKYQFLHGDIIPDLAKFLETLFINNPNYDLVPLEYDTIIEVENELITIIRNDGGYFYGKA